MPVKSDDHCHVSNLKAGLLTVKNWISCNLLLLNSNKTEMLVTGPAYHYHQFNQITLTLGNCVISQSATARNLGVKSDPTISFNQHIQEITKIAFFFNIARIRSSLSMSHVEVLIHASRLL